MTIRTPLQTASTLSVVHTEANLAELGYLIPGANRAAADRLSAMILKPPKTEAVEAAKGGHIFGHT